MSVETLDTPETSDVEIKNIRILTKQTQQSRPGSPDDILQIAGLFSTDQQAMHEHIKEIYAERSRQREEAENAL